jgi:hypothetical protein
VVPFRTTLTAKSGQGSFMAWRTVTGSSAVAVPRGGQQPCSISSATGSLRCVSPLQTSEVVDLTPEVARGISRGSGRPQSVWVLRGGVLLALPSFWSPEAADSAGIPIRMVDDRPDRSMSV